MRDRCALVDERRGEHGSRICMKAGGSDIETCIQKCGFFIVDDKGAQIAVVIKRLKELRDIDSDLDIFRVE